MYITKNFDLNKIKGREWYHQRFDGCPMFIWFIADAEVRKEKRKPAGTEADIRVCFFDPGKADWYLDMKDVKRGADAIIKLAKKDQNISKKLLSRWKKDEKKFEDFFHKTFSNVDLSLLSDTGLSNFWNKFWKLSLNRLTSSSIIDHFALGTDELIGKILRKELSSQFSKESEFSKIFSTATAPVHQSFINLAEIDLLKIITGKSKETIEDYQKRYYWSKNNYFISQTISLEDINHEIKNWKESGKDLDVELKRIEETPKKNHKNKEEFFKKYKISKELRTLLTISEDFTWWQDERKKATYFAIDIGNKILEEVAKRKDYDLIDLKYVLGGELSSIIKNQIPLKIELKKRHDGCVIIATRKGNYIVTGEKVNEIKKSISGEKDYSGIKDFRGLTASTGKVRGLVRILKSATEIGKVEKGDILVAVMTRPDYVVAMKKAAAIVTNEGGITSHAAIVSRELGIPCIIGTKIATEVLKDGDFVEVDANHGVVRKLN